MAYISLLQSLAENDTSQIGQICEKTLYWEFYQGLQDINFNYKEIRLLNFDENNLEDAFKKIDLKVIDHHTVFGASI
jgi:hypothetical protein